jgi:hypothetical protein
LKRRKRWVEEGVIAVEKRLTEKNLLHGEKEKRVRLFTKSKRDGD